MSSYELYHVTYNGFLPSIAERGLCPDAAGTLMGQGAGYAAHSRGRVFLTDGDGIAFWMQKAYDWALHQSDDPVGDGMVPVVLAVHVEESQLWLATTPSM